MNGMYALQKALRERIDDGLDWLSIKSLSASKGVMPWFWHWDDRRYALWWDSEGLPFVLGLNMLFTHSGAPRIDREECGLLDAANCRAMFCHSAWYRDPIAKHRGPANKSPIVLWPYPIDPWPGEPLPDEYDLLINAKNGHRPQLLEHLAEVSRATSRSTTAATTARSCSRPPAARGPAPTWPMTTTARSPCRRSCSPVARPWASVPARPSSATVCLVCWWNVCRHRRGIRAAATAEFATKRIADTVLPTSI